MEREKQEDVFKVEKILQKRKRKNCVEYLVKWQGYSRRHNSWEPDQNILDKALINQYEEMEKTLQNNGEIIALQPPSPKQCRRVSRRKSSRYSSCESLIALAQSQDTPSNSSTPQSIPTPDLNVFKTVSEDRQTSPSPNPPKEEVEEDDAPCLMPMVSESELWLIQERNKIQQEKEEKMSKNGGYVPIVVTDVRGPLFSVVFKEAASPNGFFSCA